MPEILGAGEVQGQGTPKGCCDTAGKGMPWIPSSANYPTRGEAAAEFISTWETISCQAKQGLKKETSLGCFSRQALGLERNKRILSRCD